MEVFYFLAGILTYPAVLLSLLVTMVFLEHSETYRGWNVLIVTAVLYGVIAITGFSWAVFAIVVASWLPIGLLWSKFRFSRYVVDLVERAEQKIGVLSKRVGIDDFCKADLC